MYFQISLWQGSENNKELEICNLEASQEVEEGLGLGSSIIWDFSKFLCPAKLQLCPWERILGVPPGPQLFDVLFCLLFLSLFPHQSNGASPDALL